MIRNMYGIVWNYVKFSAGMPFVKLNSEIVLTHHVPFPPQTLANLLTGRSRARSFEWLDFLFIDILESLMP